MGKKSAKKLFKGKSSVETVIEMDHYDAECVINEFFKVEPRNGYEIPCYEETSNDTSITFSVDEGETLDEYDREELKEKRAKNSWPHYSTRRLFVAMHEKGVVPAGKYLIKISW